MKSVPAVKKKGSKRGGGEKDNESLELRADIARGRVRGVWVLVPSLDTLCSCLSDRQHQRFVTKRGKGLKSGFSFALG